MNVWAIFPTICFLIQFITIFSLLEFPQKKVFQIILSFALTALVAIWIISHIEKMFELIYRVSFILAILNIPSLGYLINNAVPQTKKTTFIGRLLLIIALAIIVSIMLFATMFIISMSSGGYES